ncbi:hypothetical protein M404DRAFT_264661 [Pisolithus tinctorius Marx 270]|uniref:Uncharacterized protein n=1 Tax=Pisolithus tinctorius Marx 270 TaxID=870435 RepID=A0A0C3JJX6_PISTI|nr:hypothetical protein M404DRAFT_264661 [Pisolithus tinctorius Marx 270]
MLKTEDASEQDNFRLMHYMLSYHAVTSPITPLSGHADADPSCCAVPFEPWGYIYWCCLYAWLISSHLLPLSLLSILYQHIHLIVN